MLQKIKSVLSDYQEPYLKKTLLDAGAVKRITLEDQNRVKVELMFGFPIKGYQALLISALSHELEEKLHLSREGWSVVWDVAFRIEPHVVKAGLKRLKTVKNVIAVAAGKGGVGKSTVAVNLAMALSQEGAGVGLLDADIYGPSQACVLGADEKAQSDDGKHFNPVEVHGLQTISIAYLLPETDTPMVWRGPMVSRAVEQLFYDTAWSDLDYLVIDLPPGTGDIPLTLVQKIPLTAAVMVTMPQKLSELDVSKALRMFEKTGIPVLGIVENMANYVCTACGHTEAVFRGQSGSALARQYGVPLLGELSLIPDLGESADAGVPWMAAEDDIKEPNRQTFRDIARQVAAQIALMKMDYSGKLPEVVVER